MGVDHHLAGAPSRLELVLDGIPGVPGRLDSDVTIDGRTEAADLVAGRIAMTGFPWTADSGDSGASGKMNTDARVQVPADDATVLLTSGVVRLFDWDAGRGSLSFIDAGAPPLGFSFEASYDGGIRNLQVGIDRASVAPWGRVLASSLGSIGTDEARKRLEEAAGADLDGLETVLEGWRTADGDIGSLDDAVRAAEEELDSLLEDMLSRSGVELPVELPSGSKDNGGILGGLNKLF